MESADPEYDRFRLLLLEPVSRLVAAKDQNINWLLPRVSVPRWTRPATSVLPEVKALLGVEAIILDQFESDRSDPLIVAEVTSGSAMGTESISWKGLDDLAPEELSDYELLALGRLIAEGTTGRGKFSRLGWIHEVKKWIAERVNHPIEDLSHITQTNGSNEATLLRFDTASGATFWFKAVPALDTSEYRVTATLRELFPDYLPTLLAASDEWNGWLMEDAGRSLDDLENLRPRVLEEVAHHLGELQKASESHVSTLLGRGCMDQRIPAISESMPEMMTYLEEAVITSNSTSNSQISRQRLRDVYRAFQVAASRLEDIDVPDTLVHSDINTGNILIGEGSCIFTDWSQAGVGHPFANFEQLRIQLAQDHRTAASSYDRLIAAYKRSWTGRVTDSQFQIAFKFAPPIAIAMYLHTRRDWFTSLQLRNPQFVRYARSMARQLDRATREIAVREALTA